MNVWEKCLIAVSVDACICALRWPEYFTIASFDGEQKRRALRSVRVGAAGILILYSVFAWVIVLS